MRVLESFSCGKKSDDALNEDYFLVLDDYLIVMDGATPKRCPPIQGKSPARFAVETVAEIMRGLPKNLTARQAVDTLSQQLKESVNRFIQLTDEMEPPCLGMLIYSRARKEVWRLGDLLFMLDGIFYDGKKIVDDITYSARAFVIEIALRRGMTEKQIQENDVGREYITPMLNDQHVFANRPGPYGYGVLDGAQVPDSFIEVFDARSVKEIVFASDGYPRIFMTLQESESYLTGILREDPLMYQKHKSAKGLSSGYVSFDDRTYVRFLTD